MPPSRDRSSGLVTHGNVSDVTWRRVTQWEGVLVVLLALVTVDVLLRGPLASLDAMLADYEREHPLRGAAYVFARIVAILGQRGILLLPLLILAVVASRRSRSWRPLVVTLLMLLALNGITYVIKATTGRTLPGTGQDLLYAGGLGYPSGHTANATAILPLMALLIAGPFGVRPSLIALRRLLWAAGVGAVGVGLTVTVLGWHWFTDALAGWCVGLIVLLPAAVLLLQPATARRRAPAGRR
jgi:membrane-associated phospholipid phosphatase